MSRTPFLKNRHYTLPGQLGLVIALLIFSVQCSWTPEIETTLHQSQEGTISLQTTQAFKIPPQHPVTISDSRIQEILEGITQTQESGILQELLSGPATKLPIFSPSQVRFLAPQLALAFSKATPDELVSFTCAATDENSSVVKGAVAIFPPSFFFIAVKNPQNSLIVHQKGRNSSGLLQDDISMDFSDPEVVLPRGEAKAFMTAPSNSSWITMNLGKLRSSSHHALQPIPAQSDAPIPPELKESDPLENESLDEQLQELRRKVEEQDEEIKRLKQTVR